MPVALPSSSQHVTRERTAQHSTHLAQHGGLGSWAPACTPDSPISAFDFGFFTARKIQPLPAPNPDAAAASPDAAGTEAATAAAPAEDAAAAASLDADVDVEAMQRAAAERHAEARTASSLETCRPSRRSSAAAIVRHYRPRGHRRVNC